MGLRLRGAGTGAYSRVGACTGLWSGAGAFLRLECEAGMTSTDDLPHWTLVESALVLVSSFSWVLAW